MHRFQRKTTEEKRKKNHVPFVFRRMQKPLPLGSEVLHLGPQRKEALEHCMDILEARLQSVTSQVCYRNGFPMEWSAHLGSGMTCESGCTNFTEPHNITSGKYGNLGVNLTPALQKQKPKWLKELYSAATNMFALVDPAFVAKQYVIHFSKMTSSSHVVPSHTDERDICHQILVNFGDFRNATLYCHSNSNKYQPSSQYCCFNGVREFIRLDGRLVHWVCLISNFLFHSHTM